MAELAPVNPAGSRGSPDFIEACSGAADLMQIAKGCMTGDAVVGAAAKRTVTSG